MKFQTFRDCAKLQAKLIPSPITHHILHRQPFSLGRITKMHLPIQFTLLLATIPSLTSAALGASSAEPTTTLYSTSTSTLTSTIVAATDTQTLTSSSDAISAPLSTATTSSSPPAPSSSSSPIPVASTSAAPYPIASSSFAVLPSGTLATGSGIATGTGAPYTPSPSIQPFQGAGVRVGGERLRITGALVVGVVLAAMA